MFVSWLQCTGKDGDMVIMEKLENPS
jgi:hypothetical protein